MKKFNKNKLDDCAKFPRHNLDKSSPKSINSQSCSKKHSSDDVYITIVNRDSASVDIVNKYLFN